VPVPVIQQVPVEVDSPMPEIVPEDIDMAI
jgi:hypothetical protein